MELEASPNKPKLSLPTLEIQNNCYVVPSRGRYHYFPVKLEEDPLTPSFITFKKTPPILVDGFIFYKKELYEVTSDDILRTRVSKSKVIQREKLDGKRNNSGDTSNPDNSSSLPAGVIIQDRNKSATNGAAILEIDIAADTAWKDQADSLLHLISSQEGGEWEIEGVA